MTEEQGYGLDCALCGEPADAHTLDCATDQPTPEAPRALDLLRDLLAEMDDPLPVIRFPLALDDGRVWQNDGDGLDHEQVDWLNRLVSTLRDARLLALAETGTAVDWLDQRDGWVASHIGRTYHVVITPDGVKVHGDGSTFSAAIEAIAAAMEARDDG